MFVLKKPWLLAIAFAVLITGFMVFLLSRRLPETEQTLKDNLPALAQSPKREMIFVKGGGFMMGWDQGDELQKPAHLVPVRDFYMDKTEVTNAEYALFVKATGYPVPSSGEATNKQQGYWTDWVGNDPPAGRDTMPVCNVTAKDAEAFAKWLSKRDGVTYRLPTEEEWEYAARNGDQNTLFPWGNSWLEGRANLNGLSSPRHVGSFPEGRTQNGILDMVGNVWEWTASKGSYYDPKNEVESDRVANRSANILRGGSYGEVLGKKNEQGWVIFSNATSRQWNKDNPSYKDLSIGFRLVRDPG
jgi:formylglycine-generating enzyme required for sulfatase activity